MLYDEGWLKLYGANTPRSPETEGLVNPVGAMDSPSMPKNLCSVSSKVIISITSPETTPPLCASQALAELNPWQALAMGKESWFWEDHILNKIITLVCGSPGAGNTRPHECPCHDSRSVPQSDALV